MSDQQDSGVRGGRLARFLERRREARREHGPRRRPLDEAAQRAVEDLSGVGWGSRQPARRRTVGEAAERAADYLEGR